MIDRAIETELLKFLRPEQILFDALMSEHTTFKIGGRADLLLLPSSMNEVQKIFQTLNEHKIPFTILGNGSNVLVSDKGIRGAVIKFNGNFSRIELRDSRFVAASAGAKLKDVSIFAAEHSLTGFEFAVGIPGSVGGAIFMNAGAYGGEMKNVVASVRAVSPQGEIFEFDRDALDLDYRHSIFQTNGFAICEVVFELEIGDQSAIFEAMNDFTNRRESKQPLDLPSAGSTFRRPKGYFAGTLIDQTGLKGLRVGGAMVSTKHAGFVVNADHATASDVMNLIAEVQRRVFEAHGVQLNPEVRMIGEQ